MTFWFETAGDFTRPVLAILFAYAAVILLTRLSGLRSFAKMSSFDFAGTIATGSLLAATAVGSMPVASGLAALTALFAGQAAIGYVRKRFNSAENALDNAPVLLMDGQNILHDTMARVAVTEADLFAKLREANVLALSEVHAVVLESTGDISVLHSGEGERKLSRRLLNDLRNIG
mgnify:CR=1 FL=1